MSAGVRVSRVIPSVVARRTKSSAVTSLFEPDLESVTELEVDTRVKSFEQIPGPKPLPFLGNTWRFTPVIGNKNKLTFLLILILRVKKIIVISLE